MRWPHQGVRGTRCVIRMSASRADRDADDWLLPPNRWAYAVAVADGTGALKHLLSLPARGHGIAIHPNQRIAAIFARRPGQYIQLVDMHTGRRGTTVSASAGHHYYGHGVFSPDGQWLYVTEGISATSAGIIGVYRVEENVHHANSMPKGMPTLTKVNAWTGLGVGPHEIILADNNTLAVAVGGVQTQGRKPQNIATMQPALVYVDRQTGEMKDRVTLPDHQLSIRHLSASSNGQVVCGQQYRGQNRTAQPLVYVHQRGQTPRALKANTTQWQRFQHYIASVACHDGYALATSPRGNCYGIWHIDSGELVDLRPLIDVAGVSAQQGQWLLSTGTGKIVATQVTGQQQSVQSGVMWDNHWNII
ncbi:putative exported protein [Photobacterium aphoticum]|uniref:Putative exported protein n=1 Tax=Photobacterium aphoticum TaxID=754436 RepID=A0A090QQI8_9GAMM|nr:putative exported protein [Photobacterium aphoticum]